MVRTFTLALAASILAATPALALTFGSSITQDVQLVAGDGAYDGTESPILVRVRGETSSSWSSWKSVAGIDQGQAKFLTFTLGAGSGDIDEVQVYIGPEDGARLRCVG